MRTPAGTPSFMPHGDIEIFTVKVANGAGDVKVKARAPRVTGAAPEEIAVALVPKGVRRWNVGRDVFVGSFVEDERDNPFQLVIVPVDIKGKRVGTLRVYCVVIVVHELITPPGIAVDPAAGDNGAGSSGATPPSSLKPPRPSSFPGCGAGSWTSDPIEVRSPPVQTNYHYSFGATPIPYAQYYYQRYQVRAGCDLGQNMEVNLEVRTPDGALLAWNYDFPPFPSGPDGEPDAAHAEDTCPGDETLDDGRPFPRNHCSLGFPQLLGVPPPEQGYPSGGWPQDHTKHPTYSVTIATGHRRDPSFPATLIASAVWRPK